MDTFIFIYVCLISMNLDIYSTPNTMEGNKLTFNVLNTKIEDTKQNMHGRRNSRAQSIHNLGDTKLETNLVRVFVRECARV
jgi:hypothetical protein